MSKEVNIIFIEQEKGQFNIGEEKKVKLGYANYLVKHNLAVINSEQNRIYIDSVKKKAKKHQDEIKKTAEAVYSKVNGKKVSFTHKVHDGNKLYGSVSAQDIATQINSEFDVNIDRFDVKVIQSFKEVGSYSVDIKIHNDVDIKITVDVKAEPEKTDTKKKTKTKKN